MDQRIFIAQLNIEHYRQRLAGPIGDDQRRLVEQLLSEEILKLAALRTSIAEVILCDLLNFMALRAADLLDGETGGGRRPQSVELASFFETVPCGVSLVDAAGKVLISNDVMSRFSCSEIWSTNLQHRQHWRVFDSDGNSRSPMHWPGARALRGELVIPGDAAIHVDDNGRETPLRIAAVPAAGRNGSTLGAVSAVYDMADLAREDIHEQLDRLHFDEQLRVRPLGPQGGAA